MCGGVCKQGVAEWWRVAGNVGNCGGDARWGISGYHSQTHTMDYDVDQDEVVTKLKHIGPHVAARLLALFNATTIRDFNREVDARVAIPNVRRRTRELQAMMDAITRNPRAGECWEGYVVREFNANARQSIAEYLINRPEEHGGPVPEAVVRAALPLYDSTRDPRVPCAPGPEPAAWGQRTFYPQAVAGARPREGGWPYRHTGGNRAALMKAAPAAPRGRYPYSRDDYTLVNELRVAGPGAAARDAVFAANPEHPRKQWPCACFRSAETCGDMSAARGNRAGTRLPPCVWNDEAAVCAPDPEWRGPPPQRAARGVRRARYAGDYRRMHRQGLQNAQN